MQSRAEIAAAAAVPKAAPARPGDRRVVTVLFTDVSGFTAMSEKLDPEEVTEVINAFFRVLTEPIYHYGGVVDKYIGDAIMALFGAPIAHEDDPARAVMAGWEMQKAAKRFADKLEARTGIRLRVRIGLNTGLVIAGTVGGQQRQDYTVIGDTVNLAQRMESSAPVGGILVTQETYRQTRHLFEFNPRDPVTIKGKAAPVLTYEVLRPLPQPHLALRPRAPLIGRAVERDRMRQVFDTVTRGQPAFAEIIADAGAGKTRLATDCCESRGLTPLMVRCQSFQTHVPYSMIGRLLEAWLDLPTERSPEMTHERLQAALTDLPSLAERGRAVMFLAHLLHQDFETPELAALSPQQRRSAAFKALSDLLVELARAASEPLVLLVDDLQWSDEASLHWLPEFLEYLVGLHRGSSVDGTACSQAVRIAVVATYRPDTLVPDVADLERVRLALRPLGNDEAASLLAALLEQPGDLTEWPVDLRNLGRTLLSRSEGNPYFLEELVAGLVDSGTLVRLETGAWQVRQGSGGVTLPPTVNGVVASRLDRLSPALRGTLQLASVLGRTFSLEMLGRMRQSADLTEQLADLSRGGFVMAAAPGEFTFSQQIVQEVAYASMLLATRRELHVKAARSLEEANLMAPESLARHWMLGGDKGKAALYLWQSGDVARRNFANIEASDAYQQALACLDELEIPPEKPQRATLLRSLGEVETIAGDPEAALGHLEKALAESRESLEQAQGHQARGAAYERLGRFPTALTEYQAAMALLVGTPATELSARVRIDTAFLHYRLGDQARCIALCSEALDLLKELPAFRDKAMAHSILGLCLFQQSNFGEAAKHHRYALHLREEAQDWYGVASSRNNLGLIGSHTTAWGEAVGHFQAALEGFAKVGDLGKVSLVEGNLGMLLCRQGDLARAEVHLKHAWEIHQRLKNQFGVGSTLAMLGLVKIEDGQPDAALPLLSMALEGFEAIGAAEQQAEIHQLLGRAHVDRGSLDLAGPALARALELAIGSGEKLQEGVVYRLKARLARLGGRQDEAAEHIRHALTLLEPTGSFHEIARGLVDASEIYAAVGRKADAQDARKRAEALFKELGANLDLARLGLRRPIAAQPGKWNEADEPGALQTPHHRSQA